MMKRLILALAMVVMVSPAWGQDITGNDYLDMSEGGQGTFGAGYAYGQIAGNAYPDYVCIPPQATGTQISAIITKYLNDRPESRHERIANIAFWAMREAFPCP